MSEQQVMGTGGTGGVAGRSLVPQPAGGSPAPVWDGDRTADSYELVRPYQRVRGYVVSAVVALLILVGGFTAWSVFAPLATGAVAQGVINVESNRKTIQHLEGGIIRTIHVREGDEVKAGDVLITLDDTRARSAAGVIRKQLLAAEAHEARLLAQRDGLPEIRFPAALLAQADQPDVAEILTSHRNVFASQKATLEGRRQIYTQEIRQFEEEIASLAAQNLSYEEQLRLINLEAKDVETLVNQGLERRARLLGLQRSAAGLVGQMEGNNALIARARQHIAESELKIVDLDTAFRNQVVEELRGVQEQLADLSERALAAEDTLSRIEIPAPEDGTVVNLKVFTVGGVIAPGAAILDLVPKGDDLIVSAQVQPQDRESIRPGLHAYVVLTGLNRRTTPVLDGEVIHVSADRLQDQRTGMPYFEARVRIDGEQLAKLETVRLYPGMPAEVKIVTGERSALQYLTGPLTDLLRRSFAGK